MFSTLMLNLVAASAVCAPALRVRTIPAATRAAVRVKVMVVFCLRK